MAGTEVDEILGNEEDWNWQPPGDADHNSDDEPPEAGDAMGLPVWQRVGTDAEWDEMFPGLEAPQPQRHTINRDQSECGHFESR